MAPPVSPDGPHAVLEEGGIEASLHAINSASTQLMRSPAAHEALNLNLVSRRSTIQPRGLNKGGVAGVVVGCIIGVFLVGLCFYPFIVRRNKRRKRLAAAHQDAEIAQVPASTAAFTETAAPQESGTQQSSKDSLEHKDDSLTGTAKGSSQDGTPDSAADAQGTSIHNQQQERGAPVEHEHILPRDHTLSRRPGSGVSMGTHPRWNTEGPPPLSPGGIELVSTRADGLEYSEAMGGQSASYYSPTVPSEAFGMTTPPQADEAQFAAPARSISRGSSLKYNLMSLMRRMSSKDTGKSSPATGDREVGPWVPPGQQAAERGLSESPVLQDGPSFRDFGYPTGQVPRLATPVRFPISPASTADDGPHEGSPEPARSLVRESYSPPVLPPSSPPAGTVNPMDIMAPSNQSEHVWHTDRELFYLDNPHVSPPRKSLSPNIQAEAQEQPSSSPAVQAPTPASTEEAVVIKSESEDHPVPVQQELPATPAYHFEQDTHMTTDEAPARYDATHLTPAYRGHGRNASLATSEGNWTDRSDRSTPLPSQVSHHNTPSTQPTEISPSPRSELGSDIRNSVSPYSGAGPSPQIYTCDECQRGFDQIHKLK